VTLGLTQGAWDRLIFTTLGSVPALVMTAFHSVKLWSKTKDFESTLREQAQQRIRSLINDAYRDDIKNFSRALDSVTHETETRDGENDNDNDMMDIDTLWLGGIFAFILFWAMLAGPAVALYTDYLTNLGDTAQKVSNDWKNYPQPPASLARNDIQLQIGNTIRERISSNKLRLVINNPKLDAAKTLLNLTK